MRQETTSHNENSQHCQMHLHYQGGNPINSQINDRIMAEIDNFEMFLRQENMSENTVTAYCFAVTDFINRKKELTKKNLLMYKAYLMETFKPKTVNLRIQGINKYLEYTKHPRLRLKSV
jgi:response regulator RpfG family c-di-GMP phosphodiesterase